MLSNRLGCAALLVVACAAESAVAIGVPLNPTAIGIGGSHACAVVGGAVECWGDNASGQLGTGDTADRTTPSVVKGAESGASAVTSGLYHSCAIVNGGVKCWGYNADGELGNGGTTPVYSAVAVQTLGSGVTAISAGMYHTCAIASGTVKCWGWNTNGQLGDGTTNPSKTNPPVSVAGIAGATAIASGSYHTCALAGGAVKCWGYNGEGEIDSGVSGDSFVPVAAVGLSSGVTGLVAGAYHACATLTGGAVKCWGQNRTGQLGDGTFTDTDNNPPVTPSGLTAGVASLAAGGAHTCAISSGTVQCWGSNSHGQLGIGTLVTTPSPTAVAGLTGIVALSAGENTSCALNSSGSTNAMYCWGENYDGELGLGDALDKFYPSVVSSISGATRVARGPTAAHGCAVVGGAAKCWGNGESGQLGNGARASSSTPVDVSGLSSGVADIGVGFDFTCALLTSGAVKCWGGNTDGDLGIGSGGGINTLPATTIASGATALSTGYFHGCAIVGTGVQCWGVNNEGEIGDGTTTQRNSPVPVIGLTGTPVSISSGIAHTCVALSNGTIQCWGRGSSGQLGDGTMNSTNTNPPTTVKNIASGATSVAAGGSHTCAIVNGGAQCWGSGYTGNLGDGLFSASTVPVTVSGWTSNVQALAGGYDYTCGIRGDAAYCWGDNTFGQAGTGIDQGTPTAVTGLTMGVTSIAGANSHTCGISGGFLSCWGTDNFGELADGRTVYADAPRIVIQGDAIFASGFEN